MEITVKNKIWQVCFKVSFAIVCLIARLFSAPPLFQGLEEEIDCRIAYLIYNK